MNTGDEQLVRELYAQFNARDLDGVLAHLAPNVAWANGMEGTHVHGPDAVRAYWTHQWSVIDPRVEPRTLRTEDDGAVAALVHQVVRDLAGAVLLDEMVEHVFHIESSLVTRFDIRGDSQLRGVH